MKTQPSTTVVGPGESASVEFDASTGKMTGVERSIGTFAPPFEELKPYLSDKPFRRPQPRKASATTSHARPRKSR